MVAALEACRDADGGSASVQWVCLYESRVRPRGSGAQPATRGTASRVIVAPWRQAFRRRASNHMPTAARPTARCVDGSGTAVMVAPCRPLSTLPPSWEL